MKKLCDQQIEREGLILCGNGYMNCIYKSKVIIENTPICNLDEKTNPIEIFKRLYNKLNVETE